MTVKTYYTQGTCSRAIHYEVDGNGVVLWKHVGALTDEIIAGELMPALQKSEGAR